MKNKKGNQNKELNPLLNPQQLLKQQLFLRRHLQQFERWHLQQLFIIHFSFVYLIFCYSNNIFNII